MGDRKTKAVSAGGADRAAVIPSPTAQPAKRSELMLLTHLALETLTDQVMKEWAKGKAPPSSIKSLYQKEAESCVKGKVMDLTQSHEAQARNVLIDDQHHLPLLIHPL